MAGMRTNVFSLSPGLPFLPTLARGVLEGRFLPGHDFAADPLALAALAPAAMHLGWQAATLRPADGAGTLARFRANRFTGLLLFLGFLVVGAS